MKEYFEEFKEKAKNEYITINRDQFARACAKVMEQFIEKDKTNMAMVTPLIGAEIAVELFGKDKSDEVVCDE